ncbi:MAG: DUF3489 domain-containing protein [Proteobacteria bacterium]|nr:DUF3489 domain-containing protein [Pseudomonadota bacterium]
MSKSIKNVTAKSRSKQSANMQRKKAVVKLNGASSEPKSKHEAVLTLLRRKQGASLAEIQSATNWQAHSIRGFLSGTVKKRLGLKLQSSKAKDGERRYAIAG